MVDLEFKVDVMVKVKVGRSGSTEVRINVEPNVGGRGKNGG